MAIIGSLIYALWPGQIVYSLVITEEHVASLIAVCIVGCMLRIGKDIFQNEINIKTLLYSLLAGGLCGIEAFFKDWGIVIIIAAIMLLFPLLFHCKNKGKVVLLVLIILISRFCISKIFLVNAERIIGENVGNNVIVVQMFATLDPNSDGEFSEEGNQEYREIVNKYDNDYQKANREALLVLINKIIDNIEKMPEHLIKKGTVAYGDDSALFYWSLRHQYSLESEDEPASLGISLFWDLGNIYFSFVLILILLGCLIKPSRIKFFLLMILVGGIFVSLLVESQGRYKYSIEPCWCILAACCFRDLIHNSRLKFKNLAS